MIRSDRVGHLQLTLKKANKVWPESLHKKKVYNSWHLDVLREELRLLKRVDRKKAGEVVFEKDGVDGLGTSGVDGDADVGQLHADRKIEEVVEEVLERGQEDSPWKEGKKEIQVFFVRRHYSNYISFKSHIFIIIYQQNAHESSYHRTNSKGFGVQSSVSESETTVTST